MDARAFAATALLVAVCPAVAVSATYSTKNFVVTADSPEFARQVAEAAEYYRHHLAIAWLGQPLPRNWAKPCPIKCRTGRIGAGGATTFTFSPDNTGEVHVFGWNMDIQGSEERILDSVLPHEISHMIFACHFRRPLPRWADEGAATLVEHESERMRQTKLLDQVIRTSKRIPLNQLLSIKEYPRDMQDVLTLYAEGYSLANYLVQKKGNEGRRAFLAFLGDALERGWDTAFQVHYQIDNVNSIEQEWTDWVLAGSPTLSTAEETMIASNDPEDAVNSALPNGAEVRAQSPDAVRVTALPTPLPPLTRAQRGGMTMADLSAPDPGQPLASTANAAESPLPRQAISVHPAKPASPPEKRLFDFPWKRDSDSSAARSSSSSGFSDPSIPFPSATSPQLDFSR